ncbi:Hypothetical predicted protein [Cloeon dipterum]|uniref:Gustatory receptor n=1 Tax=Cloeon dipterum TaxID=197152 RepID=A0A8S1CVG2_9INSE|nr:Hypothetical predicted protein [Cloeon dipterum]
MFAATVTTLEGMTWDTRELYLYRVFIACFVTLAMIVMEVQVTVVAYSLDQIFKQINAQISELDANLVTLAEIGNLREAHSNGRRLIGKCNSSFDFILITTISTNMFFSPLYCLYYICCGIWQLEENFAGKYSLIIWAGSLWFASLFLHYFCFTGICEKAVNEISQTAVVLARLNLKIENFLNLEEKYSHGRWVFLNAATGRLLALAFHHHFLTSVCENSLAYANETKILLAKLSHVIEDAELKNQILFFQLDLMHSKSIKISVYDVFSVDRSLIYAAAAPIVAFTTTIVQFHILEKNLRSFESCSCS